MTHRAKGIGCYLTLGVIQGLSAWSAYAVFEFLASSALFRLGRPYARFTTWHWELTGQLALAYMAVGVVAGAAAGLLVFLLRNAKWVDGRPTALLTEHAATLFLVGAIAFQIILQPAAPDVWWKLLLVPLAMIAMLLLALRSDAWSTRFGLLTNPWVVAGLFLGFGQICELQFMGVAQQLGTWLKPWRYLLFISQAVAIVVPVWLGRLWRKAAGTDRVFPLNWAAAGLAAALMAAGFILGIEPPSLASPSVPIAGSSAHPNVMLIVMDTVRADHLSIFGYNRETSPNLKKLASDSTLYSHAVSAADITLTSHASILTGLYPSWHGAYCQPPDAYYGRSIGPVPTMTEVLARNGYHTLGTAANLYMRADFGLQRGFQQFRIPRPVPILAAESWYLLRNAMRNLIGLFGDTSQFDRLYSRGDGVNREFFSLLNQPALAQAPFFAFFNYMDAHFPYIPPHPYDRLFPGKDPHATQTDLVAIQRSVGDHGGALPPSFVVHSVSQYDGGIAYIDSQIGQLVDWLKRQNLYDNTMIVVTADHGESFGEGRLFQHGNSLYSNLLHVGLLVKYPHRAHTGVVDTPVSLIDIFPTVMDVAGVDPPHGLQGQDLLSPAASQPRALFSESFPCAVMHAPECPGGCLMRSVVSWPDKYISSSSGKSEIFDLRQDPSEGHNLFGSLNPTAQILATQLNAWIKTMPGQPDQMLHLAPRGPGVGAGRAAEKDSRHSLDATVPPAESSH